MAKYQLIKITKEYSSPVSLRELLKNTKIEKSVKDIAVDLSDTDFVPSPLFGMLLGKHQELKEKGIRLSILKPTDLARKVLENTQIDYIVPVYKTLADYEDSIKKRS